MSSPTPRTDPVNRGGATPRIAHHCLVILHTEHDDDGRLLDVARRLGDGAHITLANLRPAVTATLPPSMIVSELGMMVHLGALEAHRDHETQLDLRVAARSRLLQELGVSHEVVTETYHRSVLGRVTARNLRRAMRRIADRARADEIVVGPGAILECQGTG